MTPELISVSGLVLMFVLGLRHGLDPDHIACIDGLTWRALGAQPAAPADGPQVGRHFHAHAQGLAPWVGTLFAVGHGLLVTVIAVLVSLLSHGLAVPPPVALVLDWVPTLLLVLVGTLNLRLLLRRDTAYAPSGWKLRLMPRRLREHSSPWAVVLTGVLFASVFDTATQVSAWGYVASNQQGGAWAALLAGLVFTVGMALTDTIDGRLICGIQRQADGLEAARRYRLATGWLIVGVSYGVAGYNVAKFWWPVLELGETAFSLTGLALVLAMLAGWLWAKVRLAQSRQR